MDVGKLNIENLCKSTPWVVQTGFSSSSEPTVVEKLLIDNFQRLEGEMKEHYKWCKIKLHLWGAAVLIIMLVLR